MRPTVWTHPGFKELLNRFAAAGGVLDYAIIHLPEQSEPEQMHRAAALEGIIEFDRRLEQVASRRNRFRLNWSDDKLRGKKITFAEFWGSGDVEPKRSGERSWTIPERDGYKPTFFHPPYSLRGSKQEKEELFAAINSIALGSDPTSAEIYSWSTDWSNYFDAGLEWWGAFYWTVRPTGSDCLTVIGASSTD